MENGPGENPLKKHAVKIIVPILILIAIGAIWLVKKADPPTVSGNKVISGVSSAEKKDFALLVTDKLDLEKLKSYGLPIILDFGADACAPCKEMAPVLVALNEKLQGKAIIKFVDVWKYKALAEGYPLRVIPTQFFFDKHGKPYVPSDPQGSRMKLYSAKENNEHIFTVHEGGLSEARLLAALKEMGLKE